MQTLSLTKARANLTKLCQSALDGVEVAIVHNGRLVKLQPVKARRWGTVVACAGFQKLPDFCRVKKDTVDVLAFTA